MRHRIPERRPSWFLPVLRRAFYAALGVRVGVSGDRAGRAEVVCAVNLMRPIPEVRVYVKGLLHAAASTAPAVTVPMSAPASTSKG